MSLSPYLICGWLMVRRGRSTIGRKCSGQDVWDRTQSTGQDVRGCPISDVWVRTSWPGHHVLTSWSGLCILSQTFVSDICVLLYFCPFVWWWCPDVLHSCWLSYNLHAGVSDYPLILPSQTKKIYMIICTHLLFIKWNIRAKDGACRFGSSSSNQW